MTEAAGSAGSSPRSRRRCRSGRQPSAAPGPRAPSSRAAQSSPATVSAILPQRHDQHVADHVAGELALTRRTGAASPGPGTAPFVVTTQRGERLPQVARRQHAELLAQPTRRPPLSATVTIAVSCSVTRRSADSEAAETVAATERHDLRSESRAGWDPHGRTPVRVFGRMVGQLEGRPVGPLTRAPGRGARRGCRRRACAAARRAPRRCATLRCLPPVQPIAIVANRLPSSQIASRQTG